jgi:hypothetical protein
MIWDPVFDRKRETYATSSGTLPLRLRSARSGVFERVNAEIAVPYPPTTGRVA